MSPRGFGERRRVISEFRVNVGHLTKENVSNLAAIAMNRGHQYMTGPVVPELHDEFREVGLDGADSNSFERVVQTNFLGRDGFHLDDFSCSGLEYQIHRDGVGFVGVPRPVDDSTAPRHVGL